MLFIGRVSLGHISVKATLISPVTNEEFTVEALVDTSAAFTTLPRAIAERLKLVEIGERKVRTASDEETLLESYAIIKV
jgi:predicted aspartyl protease